MERAFRVVLQIVAPPMEEYSMTFNQPVPRTHVLMSERVALMRYALLQLRLVALGWVARIRETEVIAILIRVLSRQQELVVIALGIAQ